MMKNNLFACPCCSYFTLDEPPNGTYNISEVCYWEDDNLQNKNLDLAGANEVSLNEARRNFIKFDR